jgi:hypothetical protein
MHIQLGDYLDCTARLLVETVMPQLRVNFKPVNHNHALCEIALGFNIAELLDNF